MADRGDPRTEDRHLVEEFLRTRSEESFRRLYRRHTPRLYRLALRLVGGKQAEAEDAVQEAWVRAVRQLADFEWRSQLSTWLAGITINCAREILRRHNPRREPVRAQETTSNAAARTSSLGLHLDLEAALARMPGRFREVLLLHDMEGYTHDEIACLLGIDPGTSKSQLHRGRRKLRELLTGRSRSHGRAE